jgi:hypothetical protein
MKQSTPLCAALAVASLNTVVAGCAGNTALEQQSLNSVTRAEASFDRAQQAGAQRYSSRELNLARDKLEGARDAQQREDFERAERLAVEADLDAQLAAATAGNQEMQAAVTELRDSVQTLREEIQRGER